MHYEVNRREQSDRSNYDLHGHPVEVVQPE